jgi:hypothetical protein
VATIVIHAGTPKAGSSTIQRWIKDNAEALRAELGVQVLVFRRPHDEAVGRFERYEDGPVNSGQFWFRYLVSRRDPAVVQELVDSLDDFANHERTLLVTSEAFATPLAELDPVLLEGLNQLAGRHAVRVAYYVRPQHESLEAAWRQWGFRSGMSPAEYVRLRQRLLDYDDTRTSIATAAPRLSFEPRPFTRDSTRAEALVEDFSKTFLGAAPAGRRTGRRANTGLPLDVVNVLRYAPQGMFWDSPHDNRTFGQIKRLFSHAEIGPSPAVTRSRRVLHQYCLERFESGNRAMADALSWDVDHLIPSLTDPVVEADLDDLDRLWESLIPPDERTELFGLIRTAFGEPPAVDTAARSHARTAVLDVFNAHA